MITLPLSVMALAWMAGPVPSVAPLTAESLTKPNIDIWCKVLGADQKPRAVTFRLTGARGYPTGRTPSFAATSPTFTVTSDETGLFAVAEPLVDSPGKFSGEWRNGPLWQFNQNGKVLTQARFFSSHGEQAAIVLERQTQPMMSAMPDFPYAGICTSATTAQAPLNAVPTKKDLGQ